MPGICFHPQKCTAALTVCRIRGHSDWCRAQHQLIYFHFSPRERQERIAPQRVRERRGSFRYPRHQEPGHAEERNGVDNTVLFIFSCASSFKFAKPGSVSSPCATRFTILFSVAHAWCNSTNILVATVLSLPSARATLAMRTSSLTSALFWLFFWL